MAVLRALMLGDMLCATPALRALRAGLPQAQITLIGLPWARGWAARLASVDAFLALPGWPGLPEREPAPPRELLRFLTEVRDQRFDLVLQLHGGGPVTNPLVAAFGARQLAGFADAQAWVPPADAARFIAWPTRGSELQRLLQLTDHLQLPRRGLHLDLPLRSADREAAARLLFPLRGCAYAVLHPGARWASRRWPVERFVEVGRGLLQLGLALVVTGSADEAELCAQVAAGCTAESGDAPPVLNLSGRSDLWTWGAVVEAAALVVGNDTGISHMAAATGTPSVIVSSGSEVERWQPEARERHRLLWQDIACRPCAEPVCPIGHPCAWAVRSDAVLHSARALLRR